MCFHVTWRYLTAVMAICLALKWAALRAFQEVLHCSRRGKCSSVLFLDSETEFRNSVCAVGGHSDFHRVAVTAAGN